jgi:hypothetical protein
MCREREIAQRRGIHLNSPGINRKFEHKNSRADLSPGHPDPFAKVVLSIYYAIDCSGE